MIRGYPARPSVFPGGRLTLHVATEAARFRVGFHRYTDRLVPVLVSPWLEGQPAPQGDAAHDWRWPAYDFHILGDWLPGVYVAHLEEPGATPLELAMDRAAALFVVRGGGSAPILYKLPLFTWQAYNVTGGGCFYFEPPWSEDPPGGRVTLRRPGGGIGGLIHCAPDHYDEGSPRQCFAHWDAPFIRWLARERLAAEFCTDLDLHEDPQLLRRYRLLLSVGHDEYWTEAIRDAVETYVGAGGNVAFFGANTCWWRVHLVDGGTAIVCHQGGPRGARDHWWPESGAGRPEDALTGVSYRHGGGWWDGARESRGYVVQEAAHWAYAGTGLAAGETFGGDTLPPLVGYECDGAPVARIEAGGRAVLAEDAVRHGTPAGFRVLAHARLGERWQELPQRAGFAPRAGIHAAVMGTYTRGGTVFSAGTTDWAQVLATGEPRVARITGNVIRRLLGTSMPA